MLRRRIWVAALMALAALVAMPAQDALAQGKGKAKAGATALDLKKLEAELKSGDEKRMLAALEQIADAEDAGAPAAPLVNAVLRRGASVPVLTRACEVAAVLKQESSSAVLAPYHRHRVPDVRRAAVKALLKTKGAVAVKALRQALRSPDAQVRGISASGLGVMGAKEALPDLFIALKHNVGEAAGSIGQLCDAKDCEKFADLLGKHPFDIMTSGFDQILFRNPKDMNDDQKIRIVGRLRELGTKDAGNYLADVAERWPKDWSKRVKQAIDGAVKALGGAAGGKE